MHISMKKRNTTTDTGDNSNTSDLSSTDCSIQENCRSVSSFLCQCKREIYHLKMQLHSLCTFVCISVVYVPWSGISGSLHMCMFILIESESFSKLIHPFILSPALDESSSYTTSSPVFLLGISM